MRSQRCLGVASCKFYVVFDFYSGNNGGGGGVDLGGLSRGIT